MKATLKDLLTEKEEKAARQSILYNFVDTPVNELKVQQLQDLFEILEDFNNLPMGYTIQVESMRILTERALKLKKPIFE